LDRYSSVHLSILLKFIYSIEAEKMHHCKFTFDLYIISELILKWM
jgi:hypothetical protein